MKAPVSHSKDPDLQKAPQALMRAAEKARQLAEQTGTPFVSNIRTNGVSIAIMEQSGTMRTIGDTEQSGHEQSGTQSGTDHGF